MEIVPEAGQPVNAKIPDGWDSLTILDACKQIIDFRGRTPKKLGMDWGGGNIPALSAGNVKMGYIDLKSETYFGSEDLYRRWMTNGDAQKGDIVITMEAPLGNVAIIPDNRKYILSQRTVLLKVDTNRIESQFLFHLMMSANFQSLLVENSTGSTAKGIQRQRFEKLNIIVPPLHEQRAIATVLNDVDALLNSLDQLIDKKRDIHRAVMGDLLSGRVRLPGFGEGVESFKQTEDGIVPPDWEVLTLSQLCNSITDGAHYTPNYTTQGIPFYSVENLTADDFQNTKFISKEEHDNLVKRCKPERGDILFTRIGSLGKTKLIDWDVNASIYVSLALLKLNNRAVAEYVYRYTKSTKFVSEVENRSLLNAAPKKINMGDIGNIPVLLPISLAEQQAIATVLSDIEAEIVALQRIRSKTYSLKLGMMQELLTGRTRLV